MIGIGWPVCFLECKRCLSKMNPGDILMISMRDPDAVEDLVMIVDRSDDQIVQTEKENDFFRIHIRKG